MLSKSLTISEQLNEFYEEYNLGKDGGNHLPYVALEIGNIFKFYIPNWNGRRKTVFRHDIHHLITGFESKMVGEFQIAAWEIASGCMNYYAAYLLNSAGLLMGILFFPRITFNAFILGCRSNNFYQLKISNQKLLSSSLDELKDLSEVNQTDITHPKLKEVIHLVKHIIVCILTQVLSLVLLPMLVLYNIYMYLKLGFSK